MNYIKIKYQPFLMACVICLFGFAPTSVVANSDIIVADTTEYEPPPDVGKPTRRSGAGTRSRSDNIRVEVLVPLHTAYSTQDQPNLYWFISEPAEVRLLVQKMPTRVTHSTDSILDTNLSLKKAGLQSISLADYGAKLEAGITYEWSVSLLKSPHILASATIRWVEAEANLLTNAQQLSGKARYDLFARSGYWYDGMQSLVSSLTKEPQNPVYRADMAALLRQVGLSALVDLINL